MEEKLCNYFSKSFLKTGDCPDFVYISEINYKEIESNFLAMRWFLPNKFNTLVFGHHFGRTTIIGDSRIKSDDIIETQDLEAYLHIQEFNEKWDELFK